MPDTSFVISSDQLIFYCTLITALYGLYKIIKELKKPNDDLKQMVANHERTMAEYEKMLKDYDRRTHEIEKSNQMILKCMLSLINHEITGNGIDRMKELRDNLEGFIVDN